MTSKIENLPITSCYIFVDQGDQPVVAARYQIENGLGFFTYGKSFAERSDAFSFDPLNLPLTQPLRVMNPVDGKDKFGVLSDATPDNWGRKLLQALHTHAPRNDIEWLLAARGTGVGCLTASLSATTLKHPAPIALFSDLKDFIKYAREFESAENDHNIQITKQMAKLLDFGSSMGGARPKTIVEHEGKEWIAKINRHNDLFNNAAVEHATLTMARAAGINACHTQLHRIADQSILLVERFDRNCPERKKHYISAHSLINIPKITKYDLEKNYSYMGIAKAIRKIAENPLDTSRELYRRMAFNVLTGNTDDHLKNHGVILTDQQRGLYRLSPAFDVLPNPTSELRVQAIGCGKAGREASISNILSAAPDFLIDIQEAIDIIKEVQSITSQWQMYYKEADISQTDQRILARSFELSMATHPELNTANTSTAKNLSHQLLKKALDGMSSAKNSYLNAAIIAEHGLEHDQKNNLKSILAEVVKQTNSALHYASSSTHIADTTKLEIQGQILNELNQMKDQIKAIGNENLTNEHLEVIERLVEQSEKIHVSSTVDESRLEIR